MQNSKSEFFSEEYFSEEYFNDNDDDKMPDTPSNYMYIQEGERNISHTMFLYQFTPENLVLLP